MSLETTFTERKLHTHFQFTLRIHSDWQKKKWVDQGKDGETNSYEEGASRDGLYNVLEADDGDINVRRPGRHDARALASNVCESVLWNMLHVTLMARGSLRWLRDISKIFILVGELQPVLILTPHARGSVLAFGTQVRGFAPGRSRRIFRAKKILSTPSFGGEVKPSVPCRSFMACKRSLNITWKSTFRQNSRTFLAHSSTFRHQAWRRLVAKVGTSNPDRTISLKKLQCVVENNNTACN
jgi:hypothetical protein